MPKWVKVVLVVVAVCGVVWGLIIVGLFSWFNANQDRLRAEGRQVKAEGETFGRGSDAEGCVKEGVKRLNGTEGLMEQAKLNLFLSGCLEHTRGLKALCEGVPRQTDFVQATAWSLSSCSQRGAEDEQACARLLQTVMQVCERESLRQPAEGQPANGK